MEFREERGIGYCGLACVLCGYDDNCPGCKAIIAAGHDCSAGKCAFDMKSEFPSDGENAAAPHRTLHSVPVYGCYACPEYDSCEEKMPHGKRSRVFNRYAREFGEQALIDRLRVNYENGITYHTPDKSPGDYDKLETEEEIFQLLRYGRNDPYAKCPEFDTEHFHLRQVREEDAEDLLCFYGDLSEWMFNGNAWCNGIFSSNRPTAEEMRKCINSWLDEYKNKFYIRLSVIDRATGKPIGTVEVFDNFDRAKRGAALHIDLSVPYETRTYIAELLNLADEELFRLFGFRYLIIWALPNAAERIAALNAAGYKIFESDSRENYYMKRSPDYGD
ncbi:MAG: GNAT family N-acetyltransferase [Firmicutes bacterium]|nr:GNAT family N-acetyltransferase [Bacillota bacterium]